MPSRSRTTSEASRLRSMRASRAWRSLTRTRPQETSARPPRPSSPSTSSTWPSWPPPDSSRPEENIVSNMQARVTAHDNAFHVEGYEKIEYDLEYVDGIFNPVQSALADCYRAYG